MAAAPTPPAVDQKLVRNRLLALLGPHDWGMLQDHLRPFDAPRGLMVAQAGDAIEDAHFLDTGIGSVIVSSPEGLEAEGALYGRDGMAPTELLLGATEATHRIVMQVPGAGWRISADALCSACDASASLRSLLLRFTQTLAVQGRFTALSNAVHPIDERLARWLLMCDDRTDDGEIHLTHEFIAVMLAVRRPSVTTSLHVLEGNGFIRSERGRVMIRNRAALEAFAGDAYGGPEAEYRRLIGDLRPPEG